MNEKDIIGQAILNYQKDGADTIIELWIDGELDAAMQASYFFRSFEQMNALEREALTLAQGRVLDVGAGAGCHSLELQKKDLDLVSLELSDHACWVMEQRGVRNIARADVLEYTQGSFDTILMLMNGLGLGRTEEGLFTLLGHLKSLLAEGGCILADSTDISYFKSPIDALELNHGYYGEVQFEVRCNNASEQFGWIYPDEYLLEVMCDELNLGFEVLTYGEAGSFLCKIKHHNNLTEV